MHTDQVLKELIAAVTKGGSGGSFIGYAYLSWYRSNESGKINLYDYERLDVKNRALFFQMLELRNRPGWSDEELFGCEKLIKQLLL